jgi:SAM-dependent methyltransferase
VNVEALNVMARQAIGRPPPCLRRIRHDNPSAGHTVQMSIWYGANVADESELRLCGDVAGKRVIELGVAADNPAPNSVTAAVAGAKAMALDPSSDAIAAVRAAAAQADVRVECHRGDLADLGFATSASVDIVVAAHTLATVDDLPRLLRQVHRVLKPGAPFVVAMQHPVAAMFGGTDHTATAAYGAAGMTFTELYMSFERSNFRLDVVHELNDQRVRDPLCPSVLVVRARKQGD